MLNYNGRKFRSLRNSENGAVNPGMIFSYQQAGKIVTCDYSGDNIISGHLIALVLEDGSLDMRYHQVNSNGILMTGLCMSKPEILSDGKIQLHEFWRWTSGDLSSGESILLEI